MTPVSLPFEPAIDLDPALREDAELAQCRGQRIGILIVTYNALTTLTKVLKRITPHVWNNVEEIAIFDDASQDSTFELAMGMKMMRQLPKLQILQHTENLGYGGNQKAAYRYFIDKGFDIVVLLHGDGQYAPEVLSRMYSPIVRGEADAVFGSRMMKDHGGPLKGGMPLYKFVGNRILTTYENLSLGMSLTEFHSGYRAYSLAALRKIDFTHMTDEFHFDTEIIVKLHHQRYRIVEVPIPTFYGDEICYVNGLHYAKNIVRAVRRYHQTCRSVTCYPEFQEYYVHYGVKQSAYSVHYYVQRLVGKNDRVLELACGNGDFGAELAKTGGRTVTGVDRAELDDLDSLGRRLAGQPFDTVLLLDALEHHQDPKRLLEACHGWLAPNGAVLLCLPNVAHFWVRLMLLFGRFEYGSRGILDRTHLHFFTRKSGRRLARECGFRIVREKTTGIPFELVTGWSPRNPVLRAVNFLYAALARTWPAMFGYQFVMVLASKTRASVSA